jgi:predicted TPR repeat methyltransferase
MSPHSSGDLAADRRYGYAQDLLKERDFAAAADLFRQVLELTPQWAPAWFGLGEALEQVGDRQGAVEAFGQARALLPDDTLGAGVRLARLGVADAGMTPAYVAALFDEYADRFDDHLVKALRYTGPQVVMEGLENICRSAGRPFQFHRAADLGCGTGLMAAALRQHVTIMHGVDLSPAMVEKARRSGFYAEGAVTFGDLVGYLAGQRAETFDLLMATDVLVYVGDLAPVFHAARRAMTQGGLFAFTVQAGAGERFRIGEDLRYHHSEAYLRDTARHAGLAVGMLSPCVTRQDRGKPVDSLVVVLSRGAGGHVG